MRSLIPLSEAEWNQIDSGLPDVRHVVNRVTRWTRAEMISTDGFEKLNELRLSRVYFHDCVEKLRSARYALGEAVGVRKYYSGRKKKERDMNHVLADWLSRLYADYVPLLLCAATDHSLDGLLALHGLSKDFESFKCPPPDKKQKKCYRLRKARRFFEERNKVSIANTIGLFDDSSVRENVWAYRNDWVHNKPQRVESILYNPPCTSPLADETLAGIESSQLGYEVPVDHQWEEFIEMLKQGLSDTIQFIDHCTTEWETVYSSVGGRDGSDLLSFLSDE